MRYIVDFERIGRQHNPEPLIVETGERFPADDIAEAVHNHARKLLASRTPDFQVWVDLGEEMRGTIEGGRFGAFTIKEHEGD